MSNRRDRAREYDRLGDQWGDRTLRAASDATVRPWHWVAGGIVGILLLVVLCNALGIVSVFWGAEKAKLTVKPRVTQQVYSTDNALHNISYFHSQCNEIVSVNQQVANQWQALQGDEAQFRATTDPIAQQQIGSQVTQDRVNWLGVKGQLANDVADYDARSADQTSNPFKAAGLPYRISVNV